MKSKIEGTKGHISISIQILTLFLLCAAFVLGSAGASVYATYNPDEAGEFKGEGTLKVTLKEKTDNEANNGIYIAVNVKESGIYNVASTSDGNQVVTVFNELGCGFCEMSSTDGNTNDNVFFDSYKTYYLYVYEADGKSTTVSITLELTDKQNNFYFKPTLNKGFIENGLYDRKEYSTWTDEEKKGIDWEADYNTLVLDNYQGDGDIFFEAGDTIGYAFGVNVWKDPNDVPGGAIYIEINGDNSITLDEEFIAKVNKVAGTCFNMVIYLIGDGTLNIKPCNMSMGINVGSIDYKLGTLVIDGPTINIESSEMSCIVASNIVFRSGVVHAKMKKTDFNLSEMGYTYPSVFKANMVIIDKGLIMANYEKDPAFDSYGEDASLGMSKIIECNNALAMSNAEIVIQGPDDITSKVKPYVLYDETGIFRYDSKTVNLMKGSTIDIEGMYMYLEQTEYKYDGTAKKPTVVAPGLTEGIDYYVMYFNNIEGEKATAAVVGINKFEGAKNLEFIIKGAPNDVQDTTETASVTVPKKGEVITDKKYNYKITKAATPTVVGEVAVSGLKKTSLKQIKIAAKVKINGLTYKVISIDKNAFKNNKKITKVTIGKNVKTIAANAFAGCKKLKNVTINAKVLKVISNKAFLGDGKLSKVILKSNKLTKIGKQAFKGTKKGITFKVPKAKKTKYTKMIKKSGAKNPNIK